MKIGSDGLGKRQLTFNFERVLRDEVERDSVVIKGKTTAPVIWNVTLVVGPKDMPNLIPVLLSPLVLRLFWDFLVYKLIPFRRKADPAKISTEGG